MVSSMLLAPRSSVEEGCCLLDLHTGAGSNGKYENVPRRTISVTSRSLDALFRPMPATLVPYWDHFSCGMRWRPTRASMGLFSNMARYVGAVVAWSVAMPQIVKHLENDRIAR